MPGPIGRIGKRGRDRRRRLALFPQLSLKAFSPTPNLVNMQCPRCSNELQTATAGGVHVDVCQNGCGGIWFDAFELEKMDEPDESAGWLIDNIRIDLGVTVDTNAPIQCPRCDGLELMRQRYPNDHRLMIDKCRACGGIWLDFGELFGIRSSNERSRTVREDSGRFLGGLRAARS
jgi:Zn-finger nucleic acid-binding protein